MTTLCTTIASIAQHVDFNVVVVWDKRRSVCSDLFGIRNFLRFFDITDMLAAYAADNDIVVAASPMRISAVIESQFIMIFSAISGDVTLTSTSMVSLYLPNDGSFVDKKFFQFNQNGLIV
ncbi:MAG: hypothetical protein WC284_09240 [Candidimonas sp.]